MAAQGMPQAIGSYKIMRPVARGNMGTVYVGTTGENVFYAVKVLEPDAAEKLPTAPRFAGEISGDHILDYKEMDITQDNRQYFVTEYLEVKPISREKFPGLNSAMIVQIFATVAQTIADVHAKGLAHGNIKRSNVLVRRAEGPAIPYISDWGLTYIYDAQKFTGTKFATTFPYMSPERIQQLIGGVDMKTQPPTPTMDIYSLGVTLCDVLTGAVPFADSADAKELLDKKKNQRYFVVGSTHPTRKVDIERLNEAIARCTAYDPAQRYRSMKEFANDLVTCAPRQK
jgi:serine/threonine protein kinase